ncbi:tetratricopeptide repeat protein [uncultured Winogradskyella sp.]|uniref:tetratricopeptide repeat protein n=1 Tax=uncultured Winogradskyella sp. TaxID=395353 RepID=UPI00351144CE
MNKPINTIIYFLVFLLIHYGLNGQEGIEKADELYALGNYSKAIEHYKALDKVEKVYDKIAKAYVAIGNYGEALNYYKKAIEANSNNSLLQYEYAKLLKRTKNYDESKQILLNLIAADSLNPNFHYELGLILERQSDTLAIEAFNKTYTLDPSHQKAIFKIAKNRIIKGKYKDAHGLIDKGLKSYPDNIELMSLKAQAYYFQEYYTHAVDWFKKLIDRGELSEFIHEKLSLSYAQNSDYEDAIYHRKEALKYNPYDANAIFVIGSYYERLGDYENAETYYRNSLAIQDVSLSHEYQKLGIVLNRQKKYDEAIKAFQTSLKEDPSDIMTEFFLIRTKDEYYADIDTKINLYEKFKEKHKGTPFSALADRRLQELKKEKFLEKN